MRVPSTTVQNNFGKYLKFMEAGEEIIVTKNGKDYAKIVPYDESSSDLVREDIADYNAADRITYEEYLNLVETAEQHYEFIDGIVYNLVSPSYRHQYVVGELYAVLRQWFKEKKCTTLTAPFDVKLSKVNTPEDIHVVQPDLLVICDKENLDDEGNYHGVPSLIVEVLSPSTRSRDMLTKLNLYMLSGVQEYWIVDPQNKQISVYSLVDNEIRDYKTFTLPSQHEHAESIHHPGLSVQLADVFG